MRREHLLPIAALLQGPQHFLKVRLHAPLVRPDELREAHRLKVHESCGKVFLELPGRFRQGPVIGIDSHHEVGRGAVVTPLEDAVERRVTGLNRRAAVRLLGIRRRAIAQSFGGNFFGPLAQSATNVFPWQANRDSLLVHSSKSDVNVGMLGVVMDGGDPFELSAQVMFHPMHQLASILLEVQAVTKLGRYDDLEEPLVAGSLPFVERRCDV